MGQTLSLHPHLHCIVPGGGLTDAGIWKSAKAKKGRRKAKYLFPVEAMSPKFRGNFVARIKEKIKNIDKSIINTLFKKQWVVYAKQPFGHPKTVLEYLGRYTHKIAISNNRIKSLDNDKVTFSYKDYSKEGQKLEMELEAIEFIRRFAMHVLPRGVVRIRHYEILSSSSKKVTIPQIHLLLGKELVIAIEPRILMSLIASFVLAVEKKQWYQ